MSYLFENLRTEDDLWSPALRVGQTYVAIHEAMSRIVDRPTGLTFMAEDFIEIDPEIFRDFVSDVALRTAHHDVFWQLVKGYLAVSCVILQRCGIDLRIPGIEKGTLEALDKRMAS